VVLKGVLAVKVTHASNPRSERQRQVCIGSSAVLSERRPHSGLAFLFTFLGNIGTPRCGLEVFGGLVSISISRVF
jgi:hypothetical protein